MINVKFWILFSVLFFGIPAAGYAVYHFALTTYVIWAGLGVAWFFVVGIALRNFLNRVK